jgi:hypothetical protein
MSNNCCRIAGDRRRRADRRCAGQGELAGRLHFRACAFRPCGTLEPRHLSLLGERMRTPLHLAGHTVTIAVHLGARTVGQEVLGFCARAHLRTVLTAIASELFIAPRWTGSTSLFLPLDGWWYRLRARGRGCSSRRGIVKTLLSLGVQLLDARSFGRPVGGTGRALKSYGAVDHALVHRGGCMAGVREATKCQGGKNACCEG